MSAVNVFVSSERAVLLTDSSLYDPEGTIVEFDRKAFPVAAWNGAISGRGNCWGIVATCVLAERYGSFDEFIARSGAELQREHKAAIANGELIAQSLIEVTVIGWAEREDRARAFMLISDPDLFGDDQPAYTWVEVEGYALGPKLSASESWYLHRLGAEPDADYDEADFDPVRHGIPLLEAQRRSLSDPRCGLAVPQYVIGGEILVTVLDRDGVTQEVIHTWPDEAGQPIRPAPRYTDSRLPLVPPSFIPADDAESGRRWIKAWKANLIDRETLLPRRPMAPAAVAATGLSRQQRRAQARQERKAGLRVA